MSGEHRTSSRVVKARAALGSGALDDLPPVERELASALGLGPHRRVEWRAGRTAARAALAALLGGPVERYVIGRADDGAPVALGTEARVSISHGRRWAVAAAGHVARLGVDLCEIARAPSVARISRRFLAEEERVLPACASDWATLWALKEAACKVLRLGVFDGGLIASRVATLMPAAYAWPALTVEIEVGEEDVVAVAYD
jgi:4'-phosphopantetheinyl transferase EntD